MTDNHNTTTTSTATGTMGPPLHPPLRERRESGLGKFLKGLKKDSHGGSSHSIQSKSNSLVVTPTITTTGAPTSSSIIFSSHSTLPSNASSPSLTLPNSNGGGGGFSRRVSTNSLRSSNSSLSVKFMDTVTVEDDYDGASTTSLKSSPPQRPRSSTKSEKKERFSFITRSLRRVSKSNIHEPDQHFGGGNESPPISAYNSWDPRVEMKSSSGSYTSAENLDPGANIQQLLTTPEKKARRNSIFVRLLNRGKKESPTEDDFSIGGSEAGDFADSTNTSPTHSPQMLKKRTKSELNVRTSLIPPSDDINSTLREQLSEANNQLIDLRMKESEWRREREELIRKIKALSQQQEQESLSNSIGSNAANGTTSPPRSPHSHSNSFPQLSVAFSSSTSTGGKIKKSISQDEDELNQQMNSGTISKSPSTTSFAATADSLNQPQYQQHLIPSANNNNGGNPLSYSSSTISFATSTSPNPSPPPQPKRSHNRYTLAIPKWDDSMNFNGTPFERLVQALQNSCEIFPPSDAASFANSLVGHHPHQPLSMSIIDKIPSVIVSATNSNSSKKPLGGSGDSQLSASEIAMLEEKKQRRLLLSSCLEKLLYKLIDENNDISAISKTFFTTYECIYDAHEVLEKLISIFKNESPQSQMRICTIIRNWLQNYYIPALCDHSFIGKIKDFIIEIRVTDKESYNYSRLVDLCNQITYIVEVKIMERGGVNAYHSLFNVVDKSYVMKKSNAKIKTVLSTSLKSTGKDEYTTPSILWNQQPSPPPSPPTLSKQERVHQLMGSPSHLSATDYSDHLPTPSHEFETRPRSSTWSTPDIFLSIMDAPSKEIAKSLTVVDYAIFICIDPPELMNGVWGKPHMKDRALNITKLIARFNEISMNVIQTILNEEKLKDRCKVMAKLIKIAKHLHELRNYNSMMAIYAGISHSAVVRLKWTKKILPKVNQKALQDLEKLMDSEENFKNYRNELKTITTPCIPFLGLILSDMTFIQEGNPDYTGSDLSNCNLNITKLKMVYNCIKQIQQFQKNSYLLNADPRLTHLLTPNFNIFGEASNAYLVKSSNASSSSNDTNTNANNNSNSNNNEKENNSDSESDDEIELPTKKNSSINTSDNGEGNSLKISKEGEEDVVELLERKASRDLLYRSFTLDDQDLGKKHKNNYNTWSPNKNISLKGSTPSIKPKRFLPPTFERSQSETCLPSSIKSKQEIETHQLLDSIIHGDVYNRKSPSSPPPTPTPEINVIPSIALDIINLQQQEESTEKTTQSENLLNVQPKQTTPSISVNNVPTTTSTSSSTVTTTSVTSRRRSSSSSSPPSPVSPRRPTSINHSKSQSLLVPENSFVSIAANSLSTTTTTTTTSSTTTTTTITSLDNIDMQHVGDTLSAHPPRKSSRGKSISTNNIFSVLGTNGGAKENYLSPSKTHNRSSSTQTWANGGSNSHGGTPSHHSSGNVSPTTGHQHNTSHHPSLVSHGSSFSIFNKRKSIANMESMSSQRPHSFAPMTDEGLFHLSLKLEPRGVKFNDLV